MTTLIEQHGEDIRTNLETAIAAGNESAKLQTKVNEKREGAYSSLTAIGRTLEPSGNDADKLAWFEALQAFNTVYEDTCNRIATNAGGIAVKLKCAKNKRTKKGPQTYKIPASVVQAAKTVRAALELAVSFYERNEDGEQVARSFGKVRDAVSEAKAELRKSNMPEPAQELLKGAEKLREISSGYLEAIDSIIGNDDRSEGYPWLCEGRDAVQAAIEAAEPFLSRVLETLKEAEEADKEAAKEEKAGETVAAEADKPQEASKPARRTRNKRNAA